MSYENIPEELRALNQWVCWRTELRDGRTTKVPYQSRKRGHVHASSTNPATWSSFAAAVKRIDTYGDLDGIGFVFTPDDPYVGFDFDGFDEGSPWDPDDIAARFGSYVEWSPSGEGIHVIGRATLPSLTGRHPKFIGAFEEARYFTMTGNLFGPYPLPITSIQSTVDEYWDDFFPQKAQQELAPAVDTPWFAADDEIVDKCRESTLGDRFSALWDGNLDFYGGDHSAADLGFCSIVSFYTQDRDQISRIMAKSALGNRKKWRERADYREMTITKALQRSEFYTPPLNTADGVVIIRSADKDGNESEVATFNTTDMGNSLRVLHHFGDSIRYNAPTNQWYIWDGRHWSPDTDGEIMRIARTVTRLIYDEAEAVPQEKLQKELRKWAASSESERRLSSMTKLAQSEPGIPIRISDLDRNPMILNVSNGTIDLTDGAFHPHDRNDFITKIAPVKYRAGATCPTWITMLDTVFAGNADLIAMVQRGMGYTMTGDVTERAMFIMFGSGRNGKSTIVETVARILGDYAAVSSAELVSTRKYESMPGDIARLLGVRFTFAAETGEYSRMDEAKVKHITGGDRVIGERKYQSPFEFDPQFKIWLSTNHQPTIRGSDDGIWDRIRLIPFNVRIPDDKVDRYLRDKLLRESSGILNWLIEGCLSWQAMGLGHAEAVDQATRGYRENMDTLGTFISEYLTFDPMGQIPVREAYAMYKEWADSNGEHAMTAPQLSNRMASRGVTLKRVGKARISTYIGIRHQFKSDLEDPYRFSENGTVTQKTLTQA